MRIQFFESSCKNGLDYYGYMMTTAHPYLQQYSQQQLPFVRTTVQLDA